MSKFKKIISGLYKRTETPVEGEGVAGNGMNELAGSIAIKTRGDKVIWGMVLILTLASMLLVYSSTGSLAYRMSKSNESYLFKQIGFIVAGLLIIYFIHRINYTIFSRVASILFLLSIPLLIYTLFFGVELNSGSRWIKLPVINQTIQSSDIAKLSLFMYLSRTLSRKQAVIKDFNKGFLPLLFPILIICALIAPANLSTSILIFGTSLLLLFIGRVKTKHLLATMAIALIPLVLLITVAVTTYDKDSHSAKIPEFLSAGRIPTWIGRVQTFLYSDDREEGKNTYQNSQAKIAIANGGWLGVGPGNSVQRNFLPHCYSDFIYAVIIEEYGLVGAAFILFIYLVFLFRCIRLYKKCPYAFGAFLALALSFTLVIQAIANMGVNVSLFPNTGVTLPLLSMGGSSFIFTCVSIGIILSVARNVEQLEGMQLEKKTAAPVSASTEATTEVVENENENEEIDETDIDHQTHATT